MSGGNILRLKPLEFAHVLDLNSNVTYVENGPKTLILQENQKVVFGPAKCVIVAPGHYCTIVNPIKYVPQYGMQAELLFGQVEMRFHMQPFPLYPGEELSGMVGTDYRDAIKPLPVIPTGQALKLKALVDFDDNGIQRIAGDEWQIEGPKTYFPRPECKQVDMVMPVVIEFGRALKLKAKQDLVDKNGHDRVTGEEWLERKPGSYLPGVYEQVVQIEEGHTLTLNNALYMCADVNLKDGIGKSRVAGEEWLITADESEHYIPEVGEVLKKVVMRTILEKQQYCVVLDPISSEGKQQLGKKELRKGPNSFFLKPGESLQDGIKNAYLLQQDEALILSAVDSFIDESLAEPVKRKPGDIWMIEGPLMYIPPVEVKVIVKRAPIALGKNEGIYVQNQKTGKVRTVMGPKSYLLNENEALWEKEVTPVLEKMLMNGGCWGEGDIRKLAYFEASVDPEFASGKRNKTRIIKYRVPPNSAVQVYDHERQSDRVVFGPNLVILEPAEEFNILSLSAGKPKTKDAMKSLAIMLGPDYITDIIEIETLDHARLRIKYAANNKFEFEIGNEESERQLFAVPDYIGFVTRNIASRIRGRVARTSFDEFHRYSTRIVKEAVFGIDENGVTRSALKFTENNMVMTNIDVQSIEPVDTRMRDSLLKSVQLAIEISTQSIERAATHEAASNEQKAKGNLEKNKLTNEKAAEEARRYLYELKAVTAAVESSGQAKAEAKAQAEKSLIEGRSAIEAATLKSKAGEISEQVKLESLEKQRLAEIEYMKTINELEIEKAKALAEIEIQKSRDIIATMGTDTVENIALAGQKAQIGMLQGLGIRGTLITDGKTPVNLFQSPSGTLHPTFQ